MWALYFAAMVPIFLLLSFFFLSRLFSAVRDWMSTIHFHTPCGLGANLECMCEMGCLWLAEIQDAKITQKFAVVLSHNFVGLYFTTKACIDNRKKLVKSNMSSTCPHNMAHFGPLTAEICCRVWGHPSKFERVSRVSSLLQRRHLSEANLTLHDVWQSLIYTFFAGSCPLTEFCQVKDSLYVQVLRSPVLAALLHGTPAAGGTKPNYAAWYTEWNFVTFAEGANYIWLGGHHVRHRPTF